MSVRLKWHTPGKTRPRFCLLRVLGGDFLDKPDAAQTRLRARPENALEMPDLKFRLALRSVHLAHHPTLPASRVPHKR